MLPSVNDPLEIELGRVVRVLRADPPGTARSETADAVSVFLRAVIPDGASPARTSRSARDRLLERVRTFDAATLAAVVAAVTADARSEGLEAQVLERALVHLRRALTA